MWKKAKKIIALVLTAAMLLLMMAVPVSAASKIDPTESTGARIEASLYQLLDKLVSALGKVLNFDVYTGDNVNIKFWLVDSCEVDIPKAAEKVTDEDVYESFGSYDPALGWSTVDGDFFELELNMGDVVYYEYSGEAYHIYFYNDECSLYEFGVDAGNIPARGSFEIAVS